MTNPKPKQSEQQRQKFFALLERHAQLGCQLPENPDDIDIGDDHTMSSLKVIIAEMQKIEGEIDALLTSCARASA